MSLSKSILITVCIFLFAGVFLWGCAFVEQEKKADKTLALIKDLYEKGSYEEVVEKTEDSIPFCKKDDFLFVRFKSLMELGRFNEAEVLGKELLKMSPNNDEYYYLLGLLYYNENDNIKSIEFFKKAVELQPKNIDYKLNLARLYSNSGNKNEAITVYNQIMKVDPKYEVAWDELAKIYNSKGDKKEAFKIREDAVKRFSNNSYDQYMFGVICSELKLKKQAVIAFNKSLTLQPEQDTDAKERLEKLTGHPYSTFFGKQERIPLHGLNNLLIVRANVNGVGGNFLVDTGASATVLYEKFLKKNKINVQTGASGVLEMANGHKSFAPSIYVKLVLGNNKLGDVRAYILPDSKGMNLDGIIGMNVLSNFNFQIDRNADTLIINK